MGPQQSGNPIFDGGERSHDFLNVLAGDVLKRACLEIHMQVASTVAL